ncbi:nuclear transport factor 2 family protein [Actinophytocola sp.]|jgi:hypothetical protein|uniref:nuclear transport factor 2 family protein n=1 Tax=Actinophytocola sp. TaxID=1872138 RepID=UPI002ED9D9B3
MDDRPPTADPDAAIRSLLGLAARVGDEGEPDDYRRLYTPDATWTMGDTRQVGVEQIVAAARERRAEGVSGPGTATRHLVVPLHVDVTADSATAVSYFLFMGDTATAPSIKLFGTYRDELVRTADGWRLRGREATLG